MPAAHEMPDGSAMAGAPTCGWRPRGRGDEYVVAGGPSSSGCATCPASHRGDVHAPVQQRDPGEAELPGARRLLRVRRRRPRPTAATGRLDEPRWYPTLINLEDGRILAVSGLDEYGRVLAGDNEIYDPATRTWTDQPELLPLLPDLSRAVPAGRRRADLLQRLQHRLRPGRPGAAAGHLGPDRQHAGWTCPASRTRSTTRPATSFFLAPVQDQRVGIVGGGLVGDSDESTARFNVVDLSSADPRYEPAPDLPEPGAVHQRRHAARRHHAAHRRFGGLPGQRRERPAPDDDVRPGVRHAAQGGAQPGGPQLPRHGAAAARRPGHDHGLGPAVRRRGAHEVRAPSRRGSRSTPRPTCSPATARSSPTRRRRSTGASLPGLRPTAGDRRGPAAAAERGDPPDRHRAALGRPGRARRAPPDDTYDAHRPAERG